MSENRPENSAAALCDCGEPRYHVGLGDYDCANRCMDRETGAVFVFGLTVVFTCCVMWVIVGIVTLVVR